MPLEPLEFLFRALDEPAATWDMNAVRGWPSGRFERLTALGLLAAGDVATHVVCPNCASGHVEPVEHAQDRMFIGCSEAGVVKVKPEFLRTWVPNRERVSSLLRDTFKVNGRGRELLPGRAWELGSITWDGAKRKVFFMIGLHWSDGAHVAAQLGPSGKPIVLVSSVSPSRDIWTGLVPPVAALTDVLREEGGRIAVEAGALLSVVRDADGLNAASLQGAVADPKLKEVIARTVKSEIKHHLTDDELLKAYEHHGSADKAVEAIFAGTGVRIERKRIYRALKRQQEKTLIADSKGRLGLLPSHVPSLGRDKPKK